ncbi:hypothetical protein ACP4OV_019361 [Aristida adscensionis]
MMDVKDEEAAGGGGCRRKRPRLQLHGEATRGRAAYLLPHEIVTEILLRLPVKSLLRFRSVCKAWRTTISDDPSFVRAHLQHQRQRPPTLLVLPWARQDGGGSGSSSSRRIALYSWAPGAGGGGGGAIASLLHAADMHCAAPRDLLAHCDGLVLVPTRDAAHLFNPAARQVVTLPWSPAGVAPRLLAPAEHQAFGLGHDPRSGAYKVARFFYRELYVLAARRYGLTTGMEVFTVGADRHWREIAAQPPLPAMVPRAAAFVMGSLFWIVDERMRLPEAVAAPPGFLRLSLEDETFGVTPAPPCRPTRDWGGCSLSELRGELCVTRMERTTRVLELWMTKQVHAAHPRWEQRYAIYAAGGIPEQPRPVALCHDGIVFHHGSDSVLGYDFRTQGYNKVADLSKLRYQDDDDDDPATASTAPVELEPRFSRFFVVPYRESLVQIHH